MNPDYTLYVGIATVLVGLFANKATFERGKEFFSKINPLKLVSGSKDPLEGYSIHEILGHLRSRYKAEKNDAAVCLVCSLGKLAYTNVEVSNNE